MAYFSKISKVVCNVEEQEDGQMMFFSSCSIHLVASCHRLVTNVLTVHQDWPSRVDLQGHQCSRLVSAFSYCIQLSALTQCETVRSQHIGNGCYLLPKEDDASLPDPHLRVDTNFWVWPHRKSFFLNHHASSSISVLQTIF